MRAGCIRLYRNFTSVVVFFSGASLNIWLLNNLALCDQVVLKAKKESCVLAYLDWPIRGDPLLSPGPLPDVSLVKRSKAMTLTDIRRAFSSTRVNNS